MRWRGQQHRGSVLVVRRGNHIFWNLWRRRKRYLCVCVCVCLRFDCHPRKQKKIRPMPLAALGTPPGRGRSVPVAVGHARRAGQLLLPGCPLLDIAPLHTAAGLVGGGGGARGCRRSGVDEPRGCGGDQVVHPAPRAHGGSAALVTAQAGSRRRRELTMEPRRGRVQRGAGGPARLH